MSSTRREFIRSTVAVTTAAALATQSIASADDGGILKAVAFDAFTVLDPRSVNGVAEELFPE